MFRPVDTKQSFPKLEALTFCGVSVVSFRFAPVRESSL